MLNHATKLPGRVETRAAALVIGAAGMLAVSGRLLTAFVLLILNGVIAFNLKRLELNMVGLELASTAIVLSGYALGPAAGAATGLASVGVSLISSFAFGVFLLWRIPGMMTMGALAGLLEGSLITAGLAATSVVRGAFVALGFRYTPSIAPEGMIYEATAVLFTGIVLSAAGPSLLQLI